jgi:Flp pilus assembly pilin Flp
MSSSSNQSPRNLGTSIVELARDERGASFIEYVIVAGLVAIAAIGAFNLFGGAVRARIDQERGAIEGMPNP